MAVTKVLARSWTKQVKEAGGTYSDIKGINSFTVASSVHNADTTDFESGGWSEFIPAARGYTITLEGFFLEDIVSKARDAGQARCEVLALLVGPTAIGDFRLITPGGTQWDFKAAVDVSGPGGDHQNAATWRCTLTVHGQITIT